MEPFKRDWGSFGKSIEEEKQTGSKENEGECESSEKELGNPRAGERRRLFTRCIVPPRGMHPRPPQINRSLL